MGEGLEEETETHFGSNHQHMKGLISFTKIKKLLSGQNQASKRHATACHCSIVSVTGLL